MVDACDLADLRGIRQSSPAALRVGRWKVIGSVAKCGLGYREQEESFTSGWDSVEHAPTSYIRSIRLLKLRIFVYRPRLLSDRCEQAAARLRDFRYRAVKSFLVCLRRLAEAADLSDELQRGSVQFIVGHGLSRASEFLDTSRT